MFRISNKILTQTPFLKKIFSQDVDSKKIEVVSNGVDPKLFNPKINGNTIREKYNISNDTTLVIFVGAFHPWHGVRLIIKIVELLKTDNLDVKFLLVGSGPLFSTIKEEINQKKLNDDIILTGPLNYLEIPKYIAAADIGIAPFSISDYKPLMRHGFWWCPMKLFEYSAMEKPVISISAGVIPNIIPNNRSGLLSPPNDFNQLFFNLKTLINSKQLRQKLGTFGRKYVIKNFTWNSIATKIKNIYKKL